jgi:hypothetical protein
MSQFVEIAKGNGSQLDKFNREGEEQMTDQYSGEISMWKAGRLPAADKQILYWSANDLIKMADEHPPQTVIENLIFEGDTLLIHGSEENYKSVFIVQMGESIAAGIPLLRSWKINRKRRVGIIETEMHPASLGERLKVMFPKRNAPDDLCFFPEDALKGWRRQDLAGKFQVIEKWVDESGVAVLMIDTANDFFRGDANPSEEATVGEFFDRMRNLPLASRILVRHDRKRSTGDDLLHSNERIRGSSEWKEDPEAIISLARIDRRTHEVDFEVGKLRYGRKPDSMRLWFDAGRFRLIPLPPVISVLEEGPKSRQDIVGECGRRFGLGERSVDEMLAEQNVYLIPNREGHKRVFQIDRERSRQAPWDRFLELKA